MKTRNKHLIVLCVLLAAMFAVAPVLAGGSATLTGEVSESNEIITDDGTVYTIAATEKGDELAAMVGETVTATGTIQEAEGEKVITVTAFTVMEK